MPGPRERPIPDASTTPGRERSSQYRFRSPDVALCGTQVMTASMLRRHSSRPVCQVSGYMDACYALEADAIATEYRERIASASMRNEIPKQTGFRAYAFYTDAATNHLGLEGMTENLTEYTQGFEDIGNVSGWVMDISRFGKPERPNPISTLTKNKPTSSLRNTHSHLNSYGVT